MARHYALPMVLLVAMCSLQSGALRSAALETNAGPIEEIIVTARRRVEPYTAVPITLTKLDGQMLDNLQFRTLDDFLSLSPGVLVYTGGDGVSSRVSIRGVVSPGQIVEPGNAVYVDEIYASGLLGVWPGFYDIASVQVLKGPQAGLYGRNTTGGAVLITTAAPTDQLESRINASYAQYDTRVVDGMINVPLSDQVRLRAVSWYNDKNGGYYESGLDGEKLDTSSEQGGRLTFAYQPNERTDMSLTGTVDEIDNSGFTNFGGVVDGARFAPLPLAPESRRNVLRDDIEGVENEQHSVNGSFSYDTDIGTLITVAGWREVKWHEPGTDFDGTAYAASYENYLADPSTALQVTAPQVLIRDDRDTLLNAEVRFLTPDDRGNVRTQVGLSYFDENARFTDAVAPLRDFALILADEGLYGNYTQSAHPQTSAWAGFGEFIWSPSETLELTAELRYTRDHKAFEFAQVPTGYYLGSPDFVFDTQKTFTNWSPGITLAYHPTTMHSYYARYVRGFHAGGFNTQLNNPAYFAYDAEEADNYELGTKAQLFERRLEVGASIFYLRIDNALIPVTDRGSLFTFFPMQNAGVAETTGLEADMSLRVSTALTITASAGTYNTDVSTNDPNFNFENRAYVPKYMTSWVADYQRPLTTSVTGIATLGYRYRRGGRVPSIFDIKMDSYSLLDAQLGVVIENVMVAGFVQNAFDDEYIISNHDLVSGQYPYVFASGLNVDEARGTLRDPGTVFGIRMTVTF